jgi:hypothetical protein
VGLSGREWKTSPTVDLTLRVRWKDEGMKDGGNGVWTSIDHWEMDELVEVVRERTLLNNESIREKLGQLGSFGYPLM